MQLVTLVLASAILLLLYLLTISFDPFYAHLLLRLWRL